ncbi:hypothetical protein [Saccharopolyspora cebuensis]|uniref:Uncharacterized protein n=1 Tax=Saccharopolyspora cebuensis TaxID=418759 RepID=A0ABV4CDM7_9PSEU
MTGLGPLLRDMRLTMIAVGCMAQNLDEGYHPTPAELDELARATALLTERFRDAAGTSAPLVVDARRTDR